MAEQDKPGSQSPLPPAQDVIKAFGGLRPMATKLGVAVSTVQGWSTRNHIPDNRHALILKAADDYGIELGGERGSAPKAEDKPDVKTESKPEATGVTPPEKPTDQKDQKEAEGKPDAARRGSVPSSAASKPAAASTSSSSTASPSPSPASASAASSTSSPSKPAPSKPAQGKPAPAKKSGGFIPGVILGVVLVGIGFVIAIFSAPYWQPLVGGSAGGADQSEALAAIEQRLNALEGQPAAEVSANDLAALKSEIDGLTSEISQGGDLSALEDRVSDLESKAPEVSPAELNSLNGKVDSVVGQLDGIVARVDELEARPVPQPGVAPGDVALILAANELEEEVLAGLDYSQELKLVRDLAGNDASVTALLTPLDAAGGAIETRQGLAQSFAQILPDIVAVSYGEEGSDDLVSGIFERLSRVVSVRPVGDVEGDGADAIAARAEARLENADLPGAVKELEGLQGKAAEIAAPWMAAANARLAAEQSLNDLIALLLTRQAGEG